MAKSGAAPQVQGRVLLASCSRDVTYRRKCVDDARSNRGRRHTPIHDGCASRGLEFQSKKVKADEVHASFRAVLGWWSARLLSRAKFVSQARREN